MVITILLAIAQAERERILERTNEGRAAAFEAGIKFGRKPHKGTKTAKKMIQEKVSIQNILTATGISRATFYRLKREVEND